MQNENLKRNFLWNTAGSLLYFAAQWLFTILVWRFGTQQIAQQNAGLLNVSTALTNTFLALAAFGMYSFQVSDLKGKYSNTAYVNSRNITCFAAVLLCAFFVIGVNFFSSAYSFVQIMCIAFMLAFKMIEAKTDAFNAIQQKSGRLDLVGKTYALRGILSLVAFVIGLLITNSMVIALLSLVIVNVLIYFLFTKSIIKPFYNKEDYNFEEVKHLLIACAPLALYSFFNTASASVPKIMLEQIHGAQMLGIYGSVTAPVLLLQVGAAYLFTPFITHFASDYNVKNKQAFYKTLLKISGVILVLLPLGVIACEVLGEWGIRTFINAELTQYSYLLTPMVICAVLTAMVLFFSMVLTVMRAVKQLIISSVLAILTAALISVPLINAYNLQGTTFAAITALCVQLSLLCTFALVRAKKHFNSTI